jgi:hypothetical protein
MKHTCPIEDEYFEFGYGNCCNSIMYMSGCPLSDECQEETKENMEKDKENNDCKFGLDEQIPECEDICTEFKTCKKGVMTEKDNLKSNLPALKEKPLFMISVDVTYKETTENTRQDFSFILIANDKKAEQQIKNFVDECLFPYNKERKLETEIIN